MRGTGLIPLFTLYTFIVTTLGKCMDETTSTSTDVAGEPKKHESLRKNAFHLGRELISQ